MGTVTVEGQPGYDGRAICALKGERTPRTSKTCNEKRNKRARDAPMRRRAGGQMDREQPGHQPGHCPRFAPWVQGGGSRPAGRWYRVSRSATAWAAWFGGGRVRLALGLALCGSEEEEHFRLQAVSLQVDQPSAADGSGGVMYTTTRPRPNRNTGYVVQRAERARRGRNFPQCPQVQAVLRSRREYSSRGETTPRPAWAVGDMGPQAAAARRDATKALLVGVFYKKGSRCAYAKKGGRADGPRAARTDPRLGA
jgi:hypothetical protein